MAMFRKSSVAISVQVLLAISQTPALADVVQLGTVQVVQSRGDAVPNAATSIPTNAPSSVSIEAVQPQSIINRDYIQENAVAGANFTDIVNIAPSVLSVDPNGPGLMESQSLTLRGFQDGQYNVTFDGIPWGDSNDFTHHSTVYFMPQDFGGIVVDRGPGDASTFGNATFGGTFAISSKALSDTAKRSAFVSMGSWNTRLLGVQNESGLVGENNDTKYYLSFKDLASDGFIANAGQARQNFFAKAEKEVSSDTTLTAVAMVNHTLQHTPYGATSAQLAQYGYNAGLTTSASSEANTAWNYDQLRTDFEYIGLKTKAGEWTLDNKLYTYAYTHYGFYGWNTGSVSLADTQADGGTSNGSNNVPGGRMHNNYRSVGDMLNASKELGPGKLQVGVWFDRQQDDRMEQQVDWTLGGVGWAAPNTVSDPAYGPGVDRDMKNTLVTFQTYAKYDWMVASDWQLGVGGKYASFERDLNAVVNQKTLTPFAGSATWSKFLPSLNAKYFMDKNSVLYAQYSEGFLAPNLNVFYKTTPNLSQVQPTNTKNYQVGGTWARNDYNLGVAAYHIDSTNLASGVACPAGMVGTCYNVTGGVKFDGVELEGSKRLNNVFSIYANYAVNNYKTDDGSVLQNTPKNNAGLGLIYTRGNWYSTLMTKLVSNRYSNVDANGNNLQLPGYAVTNFTLRYKFDGSDQVLPKDAKLSLKINNLFNKQGPLASINSDASGNPMYFMMPTRSYMVDLELPF